MVTLFETTTIRRMFLVVPVCVIDLRHHIEIDGPRCPILLQHDWTSVRHVGSTEAQVARQLVVGPCLCLETFPQVDLPHNDTTCGRNQGGSDSPIEPVLRVHISSSLGRIKSSLEMADSA